jgi:hypothetical protein
VDGEPTKGRTLGETRRLTLREAASALGISKEAVRKRAIRGSLPTDKDPDGRVYVYVDALEDASADTATQEVSPDVLVRILREQIEDLRRERDAWREQARMTDRLLSAALERIPPQLEAPREERESPETATEEC